MAPAREGGLSVKPGRLPRSRPVSSVMSVVCPTGVAMRWGAGVPGGGGGVAPWRDDGWRRAGGCAVPKWGCAGVAAGVLCAGGAVCRGVLWE